MKTILEGWNVGGYIRPTSFSRLDLVPSPRFSFAVVRTKHETPEPSPAPSQPYKLCQHYISFPMAAKEPSLMARGPTKRGEKASAHLVPMKLESAPLPPYMVSTP